MTTKGRKYLHATGDALIEAFVKAVEQAHGKNPVSTHELEALAAGLKSSSLLDDFYLRHYNHLVELVSEELTEQRRTNALGRLLAHPLDDAFDDGALERSILPNFFHFIHLVLGDEVETHSKECFEIHEDLKERLGDRFTWDEFYQDERAQVILWHVLARIAQSFARFDARKDWFITLMQNRPTAFSVAANAFIPHGHHSPDEVHPFGEDDFLVLFRALFDLVRDMKQSDGRLFASLYDQSPDEMFGPLLKRLDAANRQKG